MNEIEKNDHDPPHPISFLAGLARETTDSELRYAVLKHFILRESWWTQSKIDFVVDHLSELQAAYLPWDVKLSSSSSRSPIEANYQKKLYQQQKEQIFQLLYLVNKIRFDLWKTKSVLNNNNNNSNNNNNNSNNDNNSNMQPPYNDSNNELNNDQDENEIDTSQENRTVINKWEEALLFVTFSSLLRLGKFEACAPVDKPSIQIQTLNVLIQYQRHFSTKKLTSTNRAHYTLVLIQTLWEQGEYEKLSVAQKIFWDPFILEFRTGDLEQKLQKKANNSQLYLYMQIVRDYILLAEEAAAEELE